MTLNEMWDAVRELHSERCGRDDIAFEYIPYGSPEKMFDEPEIIDGYYPNQALWRSEGGRGGAYMFVGADDEVLYVGKSCGTKVHGARGAGIRNEVLGKISKPHWVDDTRPEFSHYELRAQFRAKENRPAAQLIKRGRFYLGFIIVADEGRWPIASLDRIAADLEAHLLRVHKQAHAGKLPPLNDKDHSREVDLKRAWGA